MPCRLCHTTCQTRELTCPKPNFPKIGRVYSNPRFFTTIMDTNSDAQLDELDCFSSMDPASFYAALSPAVPLQSASVPRYPIRVRPAKAGDRSLNASRSQSTLRRSEREKKPHLSGEYAASLRRSARERKLRAVTNAVTSLTAPVHSASRKRTLSVSAVQNSANEAQAVAKKQRMDEKKAVCSRSPSQSSSAYCGVPQQTLVSNERRDARDKARKKWLYHHRRLFEPLLPSSSAYFETLKNEVERLDSKVIVPFHELDEQPASISVATLKDYQLYGLSFLVWMYKNGTLDFCPCSERHG